MRCRACGFDNPEGFRYCGSCGTALAQPCPSCGSEVPEGFKFCGSCGASMGGAAEARMPSERRKVVVLFADLVGFSTLAEHMDPEELQALMTDTFTLLTHEVERRDGTVEKFIGDAIMAVFGAPRAHEDDPERAVTCALAMMDVVSRSPTREPLQLRIGINSGLVVAGTVGDGSQTGVMGDAVNTAARLQQAALPGQVFVSASVWHRVRARFDGEHVGELEVKGRDELVDTYRIAGPRTVERRAEVAFVGRREELALLDLLWSSAVKGNTHVVSLVGEPGVGKSRLIAELDRRGDALDVRISCGGDRAYGAFLDLIERLLGRTPRDLEDLRLLCAPLGVDDDSVPLIAALFGLAGGPPVTRMADEQQRRQVFAAIWQLLTSAAKSRPMLVVLDDLHWADRSSVDLLAFLLERITGVPLMLLLSYRPGFDHVERASLRASHTAVRLEPLTPEESVALACAYLAVETLPEDLAGIISTRAEGNPFFIEELLRALVDLGSVAIVDGDVVVAKIDTEIPDTVQGTILARIDRLGPAERRTIQHAAAIGRTFSTELIQAITGDADIREALQSLARSQLVVPNGSDQWTFKHALVQEATYDTLLLRERKELHRKVAEVLERRSADDPSLFESLAEHYARADVPEKARRYAVAAADAASERLGFVEAQSRYETALRLWGEGDENGRLAVLMKLARSAHYAGDAAAARNALVEAAAAYRGLGDVTQAGAALAMLGRIHWVSGETDRAKTILDEAIALLEPLGATEPLLQAYNYTSAIAMLAGRFDDGIAFAERGLDLEAGMGLDAARSNLLDTLGVCQIGVGDAAGIANLREALALGERSGDPEAIGRAYVNLSNELIFLAGNREAVELCERGRVVMREIGAPSFEWFVAGNQIEALTNLGRYEEAEELSRELVGQHGTEITVLTFAASRVQIALGMTRQGRYREARDLLDEVGTTQRTIGGAEYLGEALVVEAELEDARGNKAAAKQAAREIVEILLAITDVVHAALFLPTITRLIGEDVGPLLPRVERATGILAFEARLAEAKGILEGDAALLGRAADLYQMLGLPYEHARTCLLVGRHDEAAKIVAELGIEDGPLGVMLAAAGHR